MKIQDNAVKLFPKVGDCGVGTVFRVEGKWLMRIYLDDMDVDDNFVYVNSTFNPDEELPNHIIPCVELSKGYLTYLDTETNVETIGDATLVIT